MANWFTNCDKKQFPSGYCHDPYHAVEEGEVLLWSMQFIEKEANGTEHWDMHWNKELDPEVGSTFHVVDEQVPCPSHPRPPYRMHAMSAAARGSDMARGDGDGRATRIASGPRR